jgi:hypothetical protein
MFLISLLFNFPVIDKQNRMSPESLPEGAVDPEPACQRLSNKQIGEDVRLSNKTISMYKAQLIEKLNVSSPV